MTVPLLVLSVGAVVAGAVLAPFYIGAHQGAFWNGAIVNAPTNHIMEAFEHVPSLIALLPSIAGLAGIALAFVLYVRAPQVPAALARSFGPIYRFLLNKWYFDELYDRIFVRPYAALARVLWKGADEGVVEGLPLDIVRATHDSALQAVRLQSGSIAIYAFTMLAGLVVLLTVALCG